MSRHQPTVAEQRMLRYACTYCGARPGHWCRSPRSNRRPVNLHSPRFYAATAAGLLPLADADLAAP